MANKKFFSFALLLAFIACRQSSNTDPKLVIDYNGMEPQVAKKIQMLEQAAQKNPNDAATWGKLGMTLDVHGLNEQSIVCYQKAAKLDPNDFRWIYYCAIAFKENGSAEAMAWFEKGIKLKPGYVPQQIRYARTLFDAGRLKESKAQFQQALKLDQRAAEAYVGLAQISMSENNLENARNFAETAVKINAKQSEAHSLLAILYRRLSNPLQAEQTLARLDQLPEKTALVDPVYSALVSEGESAFWYRTRGRTYMDSGLYLLAMREFKKALELHEDAEAYDNLGVALQGLGKLEEAIVYHKKAIAMNPSYLKFYNLGIAYGKLGRITEAIEAFKNSARLKPDYFEAYYNLGVAYYKLSQWDLAIKNLKLAVEKNPQHLKAHEALALAYQASGDENSANKEHELLRKLNPKFAVEN